MDKREEEKNRNKNRIIAILLLLIIFLCIYIYLGGMWSDDAEMPVEEIEIEQVEEVEEVMDEVVEEDSPPVPDVELDDEDKGQIEEEQITEPLVEEEVQEVELEKAEEEEEVKPAVQSDKKFGLTFSQRNDIWWKYQKRQGEILVEAKEKNSDKFSKTYTSYVKSQIGKLRYSLKTQYKIDDGALDYILQEGKNGKFNSAKQSF